MSSNIKMEKLKRKEVKRNELTDSVKTVTWPETK